ncbi:unnamed protein product [Anisakis simplex]|uniref:Uncharacterized protein n=1 Tax=Anisakis simplex TaxID=6269 RepID=A0A0M3J7H1_ANISI|nr:unnamed protein product [Anisakis simplex]
MKKKKIVKRGRGWEFVKARKYCGSKALDSAFTRAKNSNCRSTHRSQHGSSLWPPFLLWSVVVVPSSVVALSPCSSLMVTRSVAVNVPVVHVLLTVAVQDNHRIAPLNALRDALSCAAAAY